MKVTILEPKGYCAGVNAAINLALKAAKENPNKKSYLLGMLVHNDQVINLLKQNGITSLLGDNLLEQIENIKENNVIIFTADGHPNSYEEKAKKQNLIIYDPVCPNVKLNQKTIDEFLLNGHQVIYIGQKNHTETLSAISDKNNVFLYEVGKHFDYSLITDKSPLVINQTTLNAPDLDSIHQEIISHIPDANIKNTICKTVINRQIALLNLKNDIDLIIVVGDQKSSNTKRLLNTAKLAHPDIPTIMVSNVSEIDKNILINKKHAAISSGASTPNSIIDEIATMLKSIK